MDTLYKEIRDVLDSVFSLRFSDSFPFTDRFLMRKLPNGFDVTLGQYGILKNADGPVNPEEVKDVVQDRLDYHKVLSKYKFYVMKQKYKRNGITEIYLDISSDALREKR